MRTRNVEPPRSVSLKASETPPAPRPSGTQRYRASRADLQDLPHRHVDAAHDVVGREALADLALVVRLGVADRADAAAAEEGERRGDHAAARPAHLVQAIARRDLDGRQADGQRDAEREHLAFVRRRRARRSPRTREASNSTNRPRSVPDCQATCAPTPRSVPLRVSRIGLEGVLGGRGEQAGGTEHGEAERPSGGARRRRGAAAALRTRERRRGEGEEQERQRVTRDEGPAADHRVSPSPRSVSRGLIRP